MNLLHSYIQSITYRRPSNNAVLKLHEESSNNTKSGLLLLKITRIHSGCAHIHIVDLQGKLQNCGKILYVVFFK